MKSPAIPRPLPSLLLASSLLLCSCKPYEALNAEKISLEAELAQTRQEAAFYEKKIVGLNEPVYTAQYNLQAKMQAAAKTQAALEKEINDLNAKAEKFDAAIVKVRARLDAYKAKYP